MQSLPSASPTPEESSPLGKPLILAPITILIGTSTAGKSTICDEIKHQNPDANWQVYGQDLALDDYLVEIVNDGCSDLLKEIWASWPKTSEEMAGNPQIRKILSAILSKNLNHKEANLSLKNPEEYASTIDKFIENSDGLYVRELLDNLFTLTQIKHEELSEKYSKSPNLLSKVFEKAIMNSKAGKPTLLDLAPTGGDPSLQLQESFKEFGGDDFFCKVTTAIIHVDPKTLGQRLQGRNDKARESGNIDDIRGISAFNQYRDLYRVAKDGEEALANVTAQDFYEAYERFAKDEIKEDGTPFTKKQKAEKTMEKMGFSSRDVESEDSIKITSRYPCDAVYQHDVGSTSEIAERIIASSQKELWAAKVLSPSIDPGSLTFR